MSTTVTTPFDLVYEEQTLLEGLDASLRCARGASYYAHRFPDTKIDSIEQFEELPLTSRVDLSMADRLGELISDPRLIFRSVYPFYQNAGTFPFQVVAGDKDLYARHQRMTGFLEAAGFPKGGETLVLASRPQFFFAADLSSEILFEGHHTSLQSITCLKPDAIRRRIEEFQAEVVVLATTDPAITPEVMPDCVRAVITFRGAYPEMAGLDATVVDIYTLTEAPYMGHRLAGERFYHYDKNHFYLERSPAGMVTITSLLWEVMPLIRYQTYDLCGEVNDAEGLVEVLEYGEW